MKKNKKVEHRVTSTDLAAAPDLAREGVQEGDVIQVSEDDGVPSYTVRADSILGVRCMMAILDIAMAAGSEEKAEIAATLRQFEIYADSPGIRTRPVAAE